MNPLLSRMSPQKVVQIEFEVFGRVQGVFFRKYTKSKATALHLTGWVMNTNHKTVKGVVEGDSDNVDMMKEWLQTKGSPLSKISKTVFQAPRCLDHREFKTFDIRKTG